MTSEQDIETLELYLDGELDPAARAALERRLSSDAALEAELIRLRQGRQMRLDCWRSYEADDASADKAAEAVIAAVRRRQARLAWYVRLLDYRQQIGAAAACVAVFMIGWQWGQHADSYRVIGSDRVPAAQPVGLITQQQIPSGQSSVFEVRVTDSAGKLVRVERFATLAEAQEFIQRVQRELLPAQQQP